MNKVEKIVYDILKNNPELKKKIRNIYQIIFDFIPDKPNFSVNKIDVKEGYFFGFHDVNPFSISEKYLLANKLEIPLRMPTESDFLAVGFWNMESNKFISVQKTKLWNYHKGCRLQWLGNSNDEFIFNNIVEGKLGASIYTISQMESRNINYPIDTVCADGKWATSFSYQRLNKYMPGYGYTYSDQGFLDEKIPEETGLFLIDIEKNSRKLILSLKDIYGIEQEDTMVTKNHYVTHTEFSPNGNKIAFLHRWTIDEQQKRYTRLITCNLDGTDVHVSPTSGMVSHYVWKEQGILAYCQIKNIDGHYIFTDYTMQRFTRVSKSINSDGHQSYVRDSNFFVTDTYPDRSRRMKLYLGDLKSEKVCLLADLKSTKQFQSPTLYKHWGCDFHPRVSPSGRFVSFDSTHTGERSLCIMKLERELSQE